MTKTADPLAAPDRRSFPRRNFARLVTNEIVDMPLKLKEKSGISAGTYVDFWHIVYETLDAQFSDGNPLRIEFGSRVWQSLGKQQDGTYDRGDSEQLMDKTQRPFVCAQAFAGLGIVAYPDSPDYTGEEIGETFIIEPIEFPTGRPAPMPVERLGKDFVYDGDVRTVPSREEREQGNPVSVGVATAITTIEITDNGNEDVAAKVGEILRNVDLDDRGAVLRAIQSIGTGKTLNGASILGLAAGGKLVPALKEAGII